MWLCTGTISRALAVFGFGGKSGSPGFRSHSLSSTLVIPHFLHSVFLYVHKRIGLTRGPGFIFYGTYSLFATIYFPMLPSQGSCAGTKWAAFFGCAILSSYLFLFISFYIATYKKVDGGHKNTRSKATSLIKTKEIACVEEASGRVIGALEGCRERSWASQRK